MSLNDLILEVMKQLNGNTTGSMNANISDTIDLFIDSLNSDSLYDKAERILDAEQGDVGMTSLNAKLQYWLMQRVEYNQGDSLEDLLYRYLLNLYNVNNTALAHYVNFTDNKWHDIINDYDADLVNSNCVSATTSSTLTFATELASADSITNSGTATVTLSTTGITVTADGTLFEVYVNGVLFPFAEGIGDTAYSADNAIVMTGITWTTQDEYHYNLLNGFDMYTNTSGDFLRVPIGSTVSQTGYAYFDTFTAGANYLPAETEFALPDVQALKDADDGQFYTGGIANELDFYDIANATAEQEVIGIESTVGNDGQGQVVVEGLTVAYQEYTADVPNGGTLVFSSVSGDDYYDSLNNVIVVGTGSDITLTNNTGDTANMGVIHMDGQLEDYTEDQMLALVQTMEPGTDLQHQQNPILQANGKNQFDYDLQFQTSGVTTIGNGESFNVAKTVASGSFGRSIFKCKSFKGIQNAISCNVSIISGTGDTSFVVVDGIYDIPTGALPPTLVNVSTTGGAFSRTFTPTENFVWIVLFPSFGVSEISESQFDDLQLEKNTETAYEPFKLSQMTILSSGGADLIQRSLPNGVSDLSYTYFKKNVQNIEETLLAFNDFVSLKTNLTNIDRVELNISDMVESTVFGTYKGEIVVNSFDGKDFADSTDNEYTYYTDPTTTVYLCVPKGTYASLAEAQADLAGTIINYQLATPIITDADITIEDQNGVSQGYWKLFANGQVSGEAEFLLPIIQYKNLQHGENIFARTYPVKSNLIIYSKPISGLDQDYARWFTGRPLAENFRLLDSLGVYLFDSNNDALYVTGV